MNTITVDISTQVQQVRDRIERAAQAILTHLPDAESVVRDLEESEDEIVRMVAAHYRKIEQERMMRKIKITSDGTPYGARIIDAETGHDLTQSLQCTHIEIDPSGPTAVLTCQGIALDIVASAEVAHSLVYDPEDTDSIDQAIGALQAERERRMRQ